MTDPTCSGFSLSWLRTMTRRRNGVGVVVSRMLARRRWDRSGTSDARQRVPMTVRWRRKRGLSNVAGVLAAVWIVIATPCCVRASDAAHDCPHASARVEAGPVTNAVPGGAAKAEACCHERGRDASRRGSCCDTIGGCCSKPPGDKSSADAPPPPLPSAFAAADCATGAALPGAPERPALPRSGPRFYLRNCSLLR
jgi:hypothetical protein